MLVTIFKSKIHRVKVTQAELNYVGSITIDEDLMDAAGIYENEMANASLHMSLKVSAVRVLSASTEQPLVKPK